MTDRPSFLLFGKYSRSPRFLILLAYILNVLTDIPATPCYAQDFNQDSLIKLNLSALDDTLSLSDRLKIQHNLIKPDSNRNFINEIPVNGEVTIKTRLSNYTDPFTISENNYTRVYGDLNTDIVLPLTTTFYYSTESQNIYQSNYFSAKVNTEQLLNKFRNYQEIITSKKAELLKNSQLKDGLAQNKSLLEQKLAKTENEILLYKDSLKNLTKLYQPPALALDSTLHHDLDSEVLSKKQMIADSISRRRPNTDQIDSSINKIIKQKEEKKELLSGYLDKTNTLLEKAIKKENELSNSLDSVKAIKEQFDRRKSAITKLIPKNKLETVKTILSQIDHLDFGSVRPYLSEKTINGIVIKGVDVGYQLFELPVTLVSGKTYNQSNQIFFDRNRKPKFTETIHGISIHSKKDSKTYWSFSNSILYNRSPEDGAGQNLLHEFNISRTFLGKLETDLTVFMGANYNQFNPPVQSLRHEKGSLGHTNFKSFTDKLGMGITSKYRLSSIVELKIKYSQIQPGYANTINPFIRKDYREFELDSKLKLFKRKLTASLMYKKFRDNIANLQPTTNQMSGYGVRINSSFKGVINFYASLSPYKQGNNNPDSLLRTQNQLSVLTGGVILRKKTKTLSTVSNLNYTKSQISIPNESPIQNQFLCADFNIGNSKFKFNSQFARNTAGHHIDSLNYISIRSNFVYGFENKLNAGFNGFLNQYDNGANRLELGINFSSTLFNKLTITSELRGGKISGLYGIVSKKIWTGFLTVQYQI